MSDTNNETLNKKMMFFYAVELASAIAYTYIEGFSGLVWLAVAISLIGIIPQLMSNFSQSNTDKITLVCLILSSALWGYIIMYYLSGAPVVFSVILVARIIATIIAFKNIRDHIIVVIPLLIGFALLKQAGCIPPIAF